MTIIRVLQNPTEKEGVETEKARMENVTVASVGTWVTGLDGVI